MDIQTSIPPRAAPFQHLPARARHLAPAAGVSTEAGGLPAWKARRVLAHIDASLDGAIGNTDLARIADLSVSHFGRAFRKTFGRPVHVYVLGRRIALAQALMRQGRQALADIALACGFADQAHMTRVFGRMVGVTPHRWRQAHGQVLQ